jgi:predicted RNA methylase
MSQTPCPSSAAPARAVALLAAAHDLLPFLERGEELDQARVRPIMEAAFGGSDAAGAWVWKDAYEAGECAQVLLLAKFGTLMRRQCASPAKFLALVEKVAGLALSHTRRSETSQKLQQFSTPLPLAAIVAEAAQLRSTDIVLEPSAGTGLLAIHAQLVGAALHLNEIDETRAALLADLFPETSVTRHDAASIDDRLDPQIAPSLILMNPPFSAAPGVVGRYKSAMGQHVLSALDRLQPKGRLVLVSGANFSPANPSFRLTFQRIGKIASIRFSAPIAGRVFARHGTTTETRLTVIDKRAGLTPNSDAVFLSQAESTQALLDQVLAHCLTRPEAPVGPKATTCPSPASAPSITSLRDKARAEAQAIAVEKARHPFDTMEAEELAYLPKAWA